MSAKTVLRGITWNHSRGFVSVVATAQRYCELHPDVEITWEKRSLQEFADAPIQGLAEAYDLLVIDHPLGGLCRLQSSAGRAARSDPGGLSGGSGGQFGRALARELCLR